MIEHVNVDTLLTPMLAPVPPVHEVIPAEPLITQLGAPFGGAPPLGPVTVAVKVKVPPSVTVLFATPTVGLYEATDTVLFPEFTLV